MSRLKVALPVEPEPVHPRQAGDQAALENDAGAAEAQQSGLEEAGGEQTPLVGGHSDAGDRDVGQRTRRGCIDTWPGHCTLLSRRPERSTRAGVNIQNVMALVNNFFFRNFRRGMTSSPSL